MRNEPSNACTRVYFRPLPLSDLMNVSLLVNSFIFIYRWCVLSARAATGRRKVAAAKRKRNERRSLSECRLMPSSSSELFSVLLGSAFKSFSLPLSLSLPPPPLPPITARTALGNDALKRNGNVVFLFASALYKFSLKSVYFRNGLYSVLIITISDDKISSSLVEHYQRQA